MRARHRALPPPELQGEGGWPAKGGRHGQASRDGAQPGCHVQLVQRIMQTAPSSPRQVTLHAVGPGGEPPKNFTFDQVYDENTKQEVRPNRLRPHEGLVSSSALRIGRCCTARRRAASLTRPSRVSTARSLPMARRARARPSPWRAATTRPSSRASSRAPSIRRAALLRAHAGARGGPLTRACACAADLRHDRAARR